MSAADHPHTDPGDGRTECKVCGKWVWPFLHSCKGVPVTDAARSRAMLPNACDAMYDSFAEELRRFSQGGQDDMSDEQTGARAYGRMQSRYGHCSVHQFVPSDEDSLRCRHCDGTPHNIIHWSI